MTAPDDLMALAELCEQTTKPGRELDMRIKAAVYGGVCLQSPFNAEWCLYRPGTAEPRGGKTFERPNSVPYETWSQDRYTASLDAAMTLAEGFGGEVTFFKNGTAKAFVWQPYPLAIEVKAATPALALTAAVLKARARASQSGVASS